MKKKQVLHFLKRLFRLCIFFSPATPLMAQYHFSGQVSPENHDKIVYLSLVENYRKSTRIYQNQIIQKVKVDTLGNFEFLGNHLLDSNRIYQLYLDGCPDQDKSAHFMGHCDDSASLLFIANNKDTLQFPTSFENQALCTIASTNSKSSIFLDIQALKDEMIFDFTDQVSASGIQLNSRKWFQRLQEFAKASNEPLAELYVYDFLSDRKNETHAYYIEDVNRNTYYGELLNRLESTYPNAPFTRQYKNELNGDILSQSASAASSPGFPWKYVFFGIGVLVIAFIIYVGFQRVKRQKKDSRLDMLTAQERNILDKISEGKSNKEIASELYISLSTVKTHINNLYKKLGVSSRDEISSIR